MESFLSFFNIRTKFFPGFVNFFLGSFRCDIIIHNVHDAHTIHLLPALEKYGYDVFRYWLARDGGVSFTMIERVCMYLDSKQLSM